MAGLFKHLWKGNRQKPVRCVAVVPAAGNASRMNGLDKVLVSVGEFPVLVHTLRALSACSLISGIVVVTREDLILPISQMCHDYGLEKVTKVIRGGSSRTESVYAGLTEVDEKAQLIAIHDGARPLVTPELIERTVYAAMEHAAAAPAIPVKDTVKQARQGHVLATPDRSELFAVQTPQVFDADLIRGAVRKALDDQAELTDDCSAVERLGLPVYLVDGEDTNLKITTPTDILLAEGILSGGEY